MDTTRKREIWKTDVLLLSTLVAFAGLSSLACPAVVLAEESSCVECHTSTRNLIEETRKIEATSPKVTKSTESTGEG